MVVTTTSPGVKKALKIRMARVAWRQYFSMRREVTMRNFARKKNSTGSSNITPVMRVVEMKRSR
ncbi:MAG: hypothetical protein H6P99_568 [Holophagaceae bacterium]|nr:hypothetical protein [Holophagaceae bacterium]